MSDIDLLASSLAGVSLDDDNSSTFLLDDGVEASSYHHSSMKHHSKKDDDEKSEAAMAEACHHDNDKKHAKGLLIDDDATASAGMTTTTKSVASQADIAAVRAMVKAAQVAQARISAKASSKITEAKIRETERLLAQANMKRSSSSPVVSEAAIRETQRLLAQAQVKTGYVPSAADIQAVRDILDQEAKVDQVISRARQIRSSGKFDLTNKAYEARSRGLLSEAKFEELMAEAQQTTHFASAQMDMRVFME